MTSQPVHRLDHTPGQYQIAQSPFRAASHLIAALITKRNEMWRYSCEWIGGAGYVPCAVRDGDGKTEMLWQDAMGRWWMQHEIRSGVWLPDIDATLELVARPELGDDVSMSAEHILHGEA